MVIFHSYVNVCQRVFQMVFRLCGDNGAGLQLMLFVPWPKIGSVFQMNNSSKVYAQQQENSQVLAAKPFFKIPIWLKNSDQGVPQNVMGMF